MVAQPRPGTFSPSPAAQPIYTGIANSPHHSHAAALSAAASPSTSSPTGSNSLTKIAVAQVYLLLSTIKEDKEDPHKWESQLESLRKVMQIVAYVMCHAASALMYHYRVAPARPPYLNSLTSSFSHTSCSMNTAWMCLQNTSRDWWPQMPPRYSRAPAGRGK